MAAREGLAPDIHALCLYTFRQKMGVRRQRGHREIFLNTPLNLFVARNEVSATKLIWVGQYFAKIATNIEQDVLEQFEGSGSAKT